MMDRAGAKSYYFSDGLGSVGEMTDSVGTLQNSYTYGAWGELRAQNVTVPNSYGYTGREFAEEGLYFYRARYLDPGLGKFLSEDPYNYKTRSVVPNKYIYVANSPTNYSDAFGLYIISEKCKCGKYNIDNIKNGIDVVCHINIIHNYQCAMALREIGGVQLIYCMQLSCIKDYYPVIECKDLGDLLCGETAKSGGLYLGPKATQNACGGEKVEFWIAHETFHLCADRNRWNNEDNANIIGRACSASNPTSVPTIRLLTLLISQFADSKKLHFK